MWYNVLRDIKFLLIDFMATLTGERKWIRYSFKTRETEDPRPLIFDPRYPWWLSGQNDRFSKIIMWLPENENLYHYYDDATEIERTIHPNIEFNSRFSKPDYFKD